jgi:hypothetical protein
MKGEAKDFRKLSNWLEASAVGAKPEDTNVPICRCETIHPRKIKINSNFNNKFINVNNS